MVVSSSYTRWFETIRLEDAGWKMSPWSAARMPPWVSSTVSSAQLASRFPTASPSRSQAYADALSSAKAWAGLHALLDNLDIADVTELAERAEKARQIVYDATR
jgi:pyruvate, water dikinase